MSLFIFPETSLVKVENMLNTYTTMNDLVKTKIPGMLCLEIASY